MLTAHNVRRAATLALATRPPALARARKPDKPIDGDGDGFYSPRKGMPDKTPVPPSVPIVPGTKSATKTAAPKAPRKPTDAPAPRRAAAPKKTAPKKARPKRPAKSPRERAMDAWDNGQQAILRIEQWRDDNGKGDPFDDLPGDEPWTTDRLKQAAQALGVMPEGRATAPRLKAALVRHVTGSNPPRRYERPTTVAGRRLSDLTAEQAAAAARDGRLDHAEAAAHIRAQADEADRAAEQLRRPDTAGPDRPGGKQASLPHSARDREAVAARREREADRLRRLADRIDPPAGDPPPRKAARKATPKADASALAGFRSRLRTMDEQGLEATLRLLDSGTLQFSNPADEAAARRAVVAELRRRDREALKALEQAAEYDRLRAEQPGLDELTAWALATGQDPAKLARRMERLERVSVRQLRKDWELEVEAEFLRAEEATNGQMVKPEGRLRVDPRDFWRRPAAYVNRWASEEFHQWAAQRGGILTFAAYRAMVEGGNLRDLRARDSSRYGEAA